VETRTFNLGLEIYQVRLHPSWEAKPASIRFAKAAQSAAAEIRGDALTVLDRLQALPADRQITAVFVAAAILSNAAGLDAHDEITRARRLFADTDSEAFRSIGDYAAGELRR
jgi:hypothetical protein